MEDIVVKVSDEAPQIPAVIKVDGITYYTGGN